MFTKSHNFSLVLSGGGALGGYQVGVIKAIKELGITLNAITGTSIGALNAAIISSSDNLESAYKKLYSIWLFLAENEPKFESIIFQNGLLSENSIRTLLSEISEDSLSQGIPLYVSVYPKSSSVLRYIDMALSIIGIKDTINSEFLHVQKLNKQDRLKAIMASAAIPILYEHQVINGTEYSDGGQGGYSKRQGNTPIEPVLDIQDNIIIVVHQENASPWTRFDFHPATIIEIRPSKPLVTSDSPFSKISHVFEFNKKLIYNYINQGYSDTITILKSINGLSSQLDNMRKSADKIINIISNKDSAKEMNNSLQKIRNYDKLK
jgi:NTE family protein